MADKLYALLMVCAGASIGAVMRWSVYSWISRMYSDTFIATIAVNIVGSFFIGCLFVIFTEIYSPRLQLMLMTGVLASFTTFSTLSLDVLRLLMGGEVALALGHLAMQIIFGVSFCYLGVKIGGYILKFN